MLAALSCFRALIWTRMPPRGEAVEEAVNNSPALPPETAVSRGCRRHRHRRATTTTNEKEEEEEEALLLEPPKRRAFLSSSAKFQRYAL